MANNAQKTYVNHKILFVYKDKIAFNNGSLVFVNFIFISFCLDSIKATKEKSHFPELGIVYAKLYKLIIFGVCFYFIKIIGIYI